MNRKGFTLVEGLMVIAIIGIILMAIVPNVISLINKNRNKACEETKENIISTAKMYVAENKYDKIQCGDNFVAVLYLKENGYLKEGTDTIGSEVKITYDCTNKTFTYSVVDNNRQNVTCES